MQSGKMCVRIVRLTIIICLYNGGLLSITRCSGDKVVRSVEENADAKQLSRVPSQQESLERLRATEEMLRMVLDTLEHKIRLEGISAKELGNYDRREAFKAAKRKKKFQAQQQKVIDVLNSVKQQRQQIKKARDENEFFLRIKTSKSVLLGLPSIKKNNDLDDEAVRTDATDIDEDELNAKLEELLQEQLQAFPD